MDGLGAVADAAGIVLIEDACHALGAERKPRGSNVPAWDPVGSCRESWAACFSFHPVKSIATGEGGAVVLRDDEAAARIRRLRSHGVERADGTTESVLPQGLGRNGDYPGAYGMREIGFNYRITDIQCALGLSQLGKLDRFLEKRRALAARYDDIVPGLGARAVPIAWRSDCRPAYHLYPVLVETAATQNRAAIMGALRAAGVGTQVHYIPVHRQPYYVGRYGLTDLPGADAYFDRILSLPIFFDMTPDDVDRVVGALDLVLGGADA
jgi:dTDP-4-amino-4,6-dideoxygalactose transaminase